MGFRFKKSFNIGKHFKINLSKSGIGYSFGVKGFRIGKTAKGKTEKTLSLPGTGLSYKTIKKEESVIMAVMATPPNISAILISSYLSQRIWTMKTSSFK